MMELVKEIVGNFFKGYLSGLVLNGAIMSLAYFLFWKLLKKRFQKWRIQVKERVDAKQIKNELKNALITLAVGSLFSCIVIYLSTRGYTKLYTNYAEHPLLSYAGFFILLIIDDTWFYWMHRLLHHPKIYRHIHAVHHKSVDVNPFTSMSFHALEPFLLTLWIFPVAFFVPTYAPILGLIQIWGLLDNIKSHLGYEFFPKKFNKSWLRFLTSSTYHNMHHSKFMGNYGVHFRIWDKLLKTEFKDYEQEYDKIKNRENLSK
jgi:Delta7-sterol 5-desaturase